MKPNEADVKYILETETSWPRFQRFATDLIGKARNLNLVSNQFGNDLGRDAYWFEPRSGDLDGIVCAAIRSDADAATRKFRTDFNRLMETGLPNHVFMASNVAVTEARASTFRNWCRGQTTKRPRVEVFGLDELARMAANHHDVFVEHYRADLLNLRHRLLAADDDAANGMNGLRIALATQFHRDGPTLRDSLIDACVLLSLSKNQNWISIHQLCVDVGRQLQLPNAVIPEFVRSSVRRHQNAKRVMLRGDEVRLEEAGALELGELDSHSVDRSRKISDAFRVEVRRRLGEVVSKQVDSRLPEIWYRLQQLVADAFWTRSLEVCNRLLELGDQPLLPCVFGVDSFGPFVAELFDGALSTEAREELTTAVVGTVTDRTGVVREALLDIVGKFVGLCSIGIHPEAYEAVNSRLMRWLMLLDTHVLISWFCEAEADHSSVCALLDSWRKLNRALAVPHPVTQETAYHAWLSDYEANELRQAHGGAQDHVARTAFLRAFLCLERGRLTWGRWTSYIRKYLGSTKTDGSRVREQLSELDVKVIDAPSKKPEATSIRKRGEIRPIVKLATDGEIETELRPVWDAELLETARQCNLEQNASGGGVVILSQSGRLRAIMDSVEARDRVPVKSAASIAFSMAMLPGSSISFVHLRELLFDDQPFLAIAEDMKGIARRMIHDGYNEGLDQLGRKQLREELARRIRNAFATG